MQGLLGFAASLARLPCLRPTRKGTSGNVLNQPSTLLDNFDFPSNFKNFEHPDDYKLLKEPLLSEFINHMVGLRHRQLIFHTFLCRSLWILTGCCAGFELSGKALAYLRRHSVCQRAQHECNYQFISDTLTMMIRKLADASKRRLCPHDPMLLQPT